MDAQYHARSMLRRKLRVVCLHGWRTNETILEHQTQGLRKAFGDRAEFFFVRAPFHAKGPAHELVRLFYGPNQPYYEWYDAIKQPDPNAKASTTTAAGDGQKTRVVYEGIDQSLKYLLESITEIAQQQDAKSDDPATKGGIDVLLGFSQGAVMATLLTAQLQSQQRAIPWKLCLLVCGVDVKDYQKENDWFQHPNGTKKALAIDSIHWLGKEDEHLHYSRRLVERYAEVKGRFERYVFVHEEGHKFPTIRDAPRENLRVAETAIQLVEQWYKNKTQSSGA